MPAHLIYHEPTSRIEIMLPRTLIAALDAEADRRGVKRTDLLRALIDGLLAGRLDMPNTPG